ncbi:MAG: LCP family protein [Parasporobacterium sp.]|nr:LCP family protein [Parasporobacterium sp.]
MDGTNTENTKIEQMTPESNGADSALSESPGAESTAPESTGSESTAPENTGAESIAPENSLPEEIDLAAYITEKAPETKPAKESDPAPEAALAAAPKPKARPKRKKWKTILLIVIDVILALLLAATILLCYTTGGRSSVELDDTDLAVTDVAQWLYQQEGDEEAGTEVSEELIQKLEEITNLVVFGIDSTDEQASYGDKNRSDANIIVSIDPNSSVVKLTNILRDTKAPIEGHSPQKINAAYKYGGAPLAIKTLNQNFKLNITDYITVDFAGIETIVDFLDGVDVEVTSDEAWFINQYVTPGNEVSEGMNHMNGEQAMLYARVRKIDSDYYRASRQQTVLQAILDKMKQVPLTQYPSMIREFMGCVETSLTYLELLNLVRGMDLGSVTLETYTIPDKEYETNLWGGIDENGEWVYIYDLDEAAQRLHTIIYGS